MKISARNRLKGKIVGGNVITAAITKASADELGLAVGKTAAAAIAEASDVMVGVD